MCVFVCVWTQWTLLFRLVFMAVELSDRKWCRCSRATLCLTLQWQSEIVAVCEFRTNVNQFNGVNIYKRIPKWARLVHINIRVFECWSVSVYVKLLTIQFDSSICIAEGILGYTAIRAKVLHIDIIDGQTHCHFISVLVGLGNVSVTCKRYISSLGGLSIMLHIICRWSLTK